MKINNFIWDFDGMLFDTYPHTLAVFCEIMRRRGRDVDPGEAYAKMKQTLWDAFRFYGVDEAFIKDFYELENDLSFEPVGKPFDLIPEILTFVTENGGKNFLYTHRDKVACEYLELYGLKSLFAGCVTAENGFPLKPAPDAIEYILSEFSLKKDETLMLGDRLIDIGSGKNAGVFTCLFDPDRSLPEDESDFYCSSADGLFEIIKKIAGSPVIY